MVSAAGKKMPVFVSPVGKIEGAAAEPVFAEIVKLEANLDDVTFASAIFDAVTVLSPISVATIAPSAMIPDVIL
jgi:hypothetical protein